jgi:hypothetical protein
MLDSREIGGGTTHHANLPRKQDAKQLNFQKKNAKQPATRQL